MPGGQLAEPICKRPRGDEIEVLFRNSHPPAANAWNQQQNVDGKKTFKKKANVWPTSWISSVNKENCWPFATRPVGSFLAIKIDRRLGKFETSEIETEHIWVIWYIKWQAFASRSLQQVDIRRTGQKALEKIMARLNTWFIGDDHCWMALLMALTRPRTGRLILHGALGAAVCGRNLSCSAIRKAIGQPDRAKDGHYWITAMWYQQNRFEIFRIRVRIERILLLASKLEDGAFRIGA